MLMAITITAHAQDVQKFYTLTKDAPFIKCNDVGDDMGQGAEILEAGTKFNVFKVFSDTAIVVFPEWKNNKEKNEMYVFAFDTSTKKFTDDPVYFKIAIADILKYAVPSEDLKGEGFIVGVVSMPIKIRFGNGNQRFTEITSDVNLGLAAGHKFIIKGNSSIGITLGVSISSIKMNSETTNGALTEDADISALTIPLSVIFFKGDFQAGLTFGYDIPSGNIGRNYIYRNSPFIGIGLGYSIFQPSRGSKENGKNDN